MGTLIGFIVTRTGLGSVFASILAYTLIALIAGGSLWGYGAYKYHAGKSAGITQERIAWEEIRRRELAKQAAQKAADQAKIDQIEADYLALQELLNQERAEAALEDALQNADPKPILPKKIGAAINGVGR